MAKRIGFKWGNWGWGSERSSVSKWEDSYFGGFHRLVTDYPRVVVDFNVDFDFATIKHLAYWEKEKLCKMFLSKTKNNGLVDRLLKNAKTETESSFLYGEVLKTTIDKTDREIVLDAIIAKDVEYAPLFRHYREFIIDTEINFKHPKGGGKNGKSGGDTKDDNKSEEKNNEDSQSQDQGQEKDQDKKNDSDNQEDNEKNQNGRGESNSDESEQDQDDIIQNLIDFEKALNDIKEEELYKYNSVCNFNKKTKTKIQDQLQETQYTKEEEDVADNLTKLLDISFDPTSDTVKNLRLGKLDITKIAEVPAGNISIYKQEIENQTTKPFSVVILCDESGSMEQSGRIGSQYRIVKSLYRSFSEILPQDKIFVYGHSGQYEPELYVYHDPYNENFMTTIDQMLRRGHRNNYDGPIIEEVHKNIRNITSDRIIFIVLSDGYPCGQNYGGPIAYANMKQIVEKCKRDDFVTVGIGIGTFHVKDLYQYSAVVEDGNLYDMPKKVSHIVNHVVKTEFQ